MTLLRLAGSAGAMEVTPDPGPRMRQWFRRKQFWVGRAWSNPVIWKDFHFISGGWTALLGRCVLYGVMLPLGVMVLTAGSLRGVPLFPVLVLIVLKFSIIEPWSIMKLSFQTESKERTLAGIMILPHSARWIVYSKAAGSLIGFVPPACAICCAIFGLLYCQWTSQLDRGVEIVAAHWSWGLVILIEFFVWTHRNAALQPMQLTLRNWHPDKTALIRLKTVIACLYAFVPLVLLTVLGTAWWLQWDPVNALASVATPMGFLWGTKGCLEIVALQYVIADQLRAAAAAE
jgi:hypothetical protein